MDGCRAWFFRHVVGLPTLYSRHARDHVPLSRKCKNRSLVEKVELLVKSIEMSDDSYSLDVVNVLTIQNGITFLISLMSLVTRTQLDRPKIKGALKCLDTL